MSDLEGEVRRIYDAFLRGDYGTVTEALDPEVEFRNPDHAIEPGVRRGPTAFRRALETLNELFDYDRLGVEDIRLVDDTVVVAYRAVGRGRESGVPVDQVFGHVWVFESGKVKSLEWFATFDEALAAASP